jgi:hypothetical protein
MSKATAAILTAAACAMTQTANAAPLDLETITPTFTAANSTVEFFEDFPSLGEGELLAFGATITAADGVNPIAPATIDFTFGFPLTDPTDNPSGFFDVVDGSFSSVLSGDTVLALGFSENLVEVQFGNHTGSAGTDFNDSVLLSIAFADDLGADPFGALVGGGFYDATLTLANVAEVPAPAALPLLLTGLAGLALFRKRARTDPIG